MRSEKTFRAEFSEKAHISPFQNWSRSEVKMGFSGSRARADGVWRVLLTSRFDSAEVFGHIAPLNGW